MINFSHCTSGNHLDLSKLTFMILTALERSTTECVLVTLNTYNYISSEWGSENGAELDEKLSEFAETLCLSRLKALQISHVPLLCLFLQKSMDFLPCILEHIHFLRSGAKQLVKEAPKL